MARQRQPWFAALRQSGGMLLSIDRERLLPQPDPQRRQIMIRHGTFLALPVLALQARGQVADTTMDDPEPGRRTRQTQGPALRDITLLLAAGVQHLRVRGRTSRRFGGMDLHSDADRARLKASIAQPACRLPARVAVA